MTEKEIRPTRIVNDVTLIQNTEESTERTTKDTPHSLKNVHKLSLLEILRDGGSGTDLHGTASDITCVMR